MTEQTTYPVNATVGQDGEVSVRHSKPVTGSPQAIIHLHADFREVAPKPSGKTLVERINEAYDKDAEREDEEFFRSTKEYYRRRRNAED